MEKTVRKAIVCLLMVGFMQAGLSAPLIEAAPENNIQTKEDQRQEKEKQQQEKDKQQQEKQQQDKQQQDKQRQDQQRLEQQRQDKQRQDQERLEQQRQEQQRQDQERQDQERLEQQRLEKQRQDQQRLEQQRLEKQRQDQQRLEQQRQEKQRQDQQRLEQRRYNWSHSDYRDNNWLRTAFSYNEPSHFRWHESSYSMRERFKSSDYWMEPIYDREWNDRFPGLHSYRWHDNDRYSEGYFWYRGVRIRDAALFYDHWDELVGIGFMFDNVFVFIRDDQEVYHRNDSLLLNMAILLLTREDRQQWRETKRYDWSHDAYRDNNWNQAAFFYNDPSPFRWHESRYSMRERFSSADYEYRLEPIYDREWNDRFPGLHSYRWHDGNRYSHAGYFWYRGVRIRDAVLFYDNWDELVGIGFMHDNVFVFIRDDQEVHHRNDPLLLGIIIFLLTR